MHCRSFRRSPRWQASAPKLTGPKPQKCCRHDEDTRLASICRTETPEIQMREFSPDREDFRYQLARTLRRSDKRSKSIRVEAASVLALISECGNNRQRAVNMTSRRLLLRILV